MEEMKRAVAIEGLKMIERARPTNPQSEKNKPLAFLSHSICFAFDTYFPASPRELLLNKSLHIWYAMKLLQLLW